MNKISSSKKKETIDMFQQAAIDKLTDYPVCLKIETPDCNATKYCYEIRYGIDFRISVEFRKNSHWNKMMVEIDRTLWTNKNHDFLIGYLKKPYEIITLSQFYEYTGIDKKTLELLIKLNK